jgi:hypothetical protein
MIKNTKEYKDFSNFVDDSGGQVRNVDKENKSVLASANKAQNDYNLITF